MKIIKQGELHRLTCGNCATVFEYDQADIQLVPRRVEAGPWEVECAPEPEDHYYGRVSCPSCRMGIAVDTNRAQRRSILARPMEDAS